MGNEQITIVVAVIKNEAGQILIAKRNQPDLPEEHNKWEFVGGGIKFGEDPKEALVREVKEESGLDVKIIRLMPKILTQNWENQSPKRHIIILTYECETVGGQLKAGEDEILEIKFINSKDVGKYDCLPNVKKILKLLTNG